MGKPGAIEERVLSVLRARTTGTPPVVTLSWAQTLNEVIAARRGERTALSSPESLTLVHRIRSYHSGILVGIETVLSDDPLLSVRLAEGPQPQPIILDSRLRMPTESRLMGRSDVKPWIFHSSPSKGEGAGLKARGAKLFRVAAASTGLDLYEVLDSLAREGIESLLVEGGAKVIESFLRVGTANQAVITLVPMFLPGYALFKGQGPEVPVRFKATVWETFGTDAVLWGGMGP